MRISVGCEICAEQRASRLATEQRGRIPLWDAKEDKMKMILLVLSAALLAGVADAADIDGRAQGELLRKPYVSTVTGEKREYVLSLPKGYETETGKLWPVILFLHGGGERGDGKADLEKLLLHGPLKEVWQKGRDLPFIIVSPQMPPRDRPRTPRREEPEGEREPPPMTREITGEKPRWDPQGPPQGWWVYEKDVLNMVDATLKEYRADSERLYVTGLSYGGFGTFHYAGAYPSRWAAVAPICGAANPEALPRIAAAKLPIWIITGGRDQVVRPEWVLQSAVALEEAGHPDVRFTVHEDLPHDVWTRVYEGWDLYNWFLQHRRKQ